MKPSGPVRRNRLSSEKSPYLLQHQANPVDWYPWGPEAFERARKKDCLIFLSIGYSTCHWCHVMEKESFENEQIAALLNESFVSVKVDREERPDIDQIYMSAVQALTGSGGWPLTVFITPDGRPVTGGTYFPPEDRWGRPGMTTILPRMAEMWKKDRQGMTQAGEQFVQVLQTKPDAKTPALPSDQIMQKAFEQLRASFDPENGGFGGAPKFPRSHDLQFLLRYGTRFKKAEALQMVEATLAGMARGGIYDHLGGGFARYSTDAAWRVPHFEKMLYDQAVISKTFLETYQVTQNPFYAEVASDIFKYVLRDMTDLAGGFYSAEDADSEGEEGKFYVWRPEEIRQVLGLKRGDLFCEFYDVTEDGNFEHRTSILHPVQDPASFAAKHGTSADQMETLLAEGREKLFKIRSARVRPHLDDKVLTAWNGMMTAALAFGARVLDRKVWYEAAARNADFILTRMTREGRLMRRYRDGEVSIPAFQEDYAFLIYGLLELYEAGFDPRWLESAKTLAEDMIRLFWDDRDGGFFYTGHDAEKLLIRPKEYYDGAVPSGNSMAASVLFRLSRMLEDSAAITEKAEQTVRSNAHWLSRSPMNFTQMLQVLDSLSGSHSEMVLTGSMEGPLFEALRGVINRRFLPRTVHLAYPAGDWGSRTAALRPFAFRSNPKKTEVTAYFCQDYVCREPVHDPEVLAEYLDKGEVS